MSVKKFIVSLAVLALAFSISCGKKEPEKVFKTVAVDSYLVEDPAAKKPVNVPNGKVKRGEYVIFNEERDFSGKKYLNVSIEGVSTKGWILAANVKDGKLQSVTVIKDEDLYARPNIKSEKTGTVKAGQVAFKIEEANEFVLIQFPGKEAYILKSSLGDASMVVRTITIPGLGKATISASSQFLSSEGKETLYDPRNAFDGKLNTSWCEGKRDDDGIGEYIILSFENPVVLTNVAVVNGYAASDETYTGNNRVASLKVVSSNGYEQVIELVDSNLDYQRTDMNLYGSTFKFMINKVYKGKVSDTCISEIKLEGRTDFDSGEGYSEGDGEGDAH